MPYEYLDDIAAADIAFKAWHEKLEQTFVSAAEATMNVMIEELESIKPRERREIRLDNDALDMLLFEFLQELIYYKDSELMLLRVRELGLETADGRYSLRAQAEGEKLDLSRHHTRVDVKAVTLHRFALEQTERGWEATVVLDI
jgi:SHS2 domain-containing protein